MRSPGAPFKGEVGIEEMKEIKDLSGTAVKQISRLYLLDRRLSFISSSPLKSACIPKL
jgi:hypothetical protein